MLDMGFLPDIKRIMAKMPNQRQTMMFSATFPDEIQRLTNEMMDEPERVAIGQVAKPVESVRQLLYPVRTEDKSRLLLRLLKEQDISPKRLKMSGLCSVCADNFVAHMSKFQGELKKLESND